MLLLVPPARDVEAVLDWLVRLTGATPYDARQLLLRGAPVLLRASETAAEWAAHLRSAGLEAWAMEEGAVGALPPQFDAASISFSADGLAVTTTTNESLVLPADAVQAVVRARRDAAGGKGHADNPCFYVLCAAPDALVRFELGCVDARALGPHLTASARQNHLALQAIVEHGAIHALLDARLEGLGGKMPPLPKAAAAQDRLTLVGAEGPFEEGVLLLCLARRAALHLVHP